MTLDITKPTDQELVSVLPLYIRANRTAINLFADSTDFDSTTLIITAGDTALTVGVDLSSAKIEVVRISCTGAANIAKIRGGTEGNIKIFIFGSNTINFIDGTKSDGKLYLNQLPVLSSFDAQLDDVIALTNIDGDGAGAYGYWKELWRQLSVK